MSRYDYEYDYYDFDEIQYSTNPLNITDVSEMRHYVNCHGITQLLINYLKSSFEEISDIYDYVRGYTNISDMKNKTLRSKAIEEGKDYKQSREEALAKNAELVYNFEYSQKHNLCSGVGTRRVKLFLNKKIKSGDVIAHMYRLALEIEHKNIEAKASYGEYIDKIYQLKSDLIRELISVCKDNNVVYGLQTSDVVKVSHIIYFELPDMEQISFHNSFTLLEESVLPIYNKEWDGKVNSTISKIESSISRRYGDELIEYNRKVEVDAKKRRDIKEMKLAIEREKIFNEEKTEFIKTKNNILSLFKSVFIKYKNMLSVPTFRTSAITRLYNDIDLTICELKHKFEKFSIDIPDDFSEISDEFETLRKKQKHLLEIPTEFNWLKQKLSSMKGDGKRYNKICQKDDSQLNKKDRKFKNKYPRELEKIKTLKEKYEEYL